MNLADFLTRQALTNPDALAVIHGEQRLSYAELESLVWGLCHHFRDAGLNEGDVVGLHVREPLLLMAAVIALARSGVVNVTLPTEPNSTASQESLLARTAARAVVGEGSAQNWAARLRVLLEPQTALALRGEPDETLRADRVGALLMYSNSSGTTGVPKVFGVTHEGAMSSLLAEVECIGYRPGERYLSLVSPSYAAPRRRYMCCLAAGGTAVMPPIDRSWTSIAAVIDRHDVRHFSCVPSQAFAMAHAIPAGEGPRFPQVRCLRLSAGPSEASLHQLLRARLTPNVMVSYGCNELGPLTVAPPAMLAQHPNTVGRPIRGVDVEVVDTDDRVLQAGKVGQIRLRASGMPAGYLNDESATAKSFRGGWFYPGDLALWNADGLLCHMGRADDMMIMDGINIYPAEIEQAMMTHPAVRDAVAFALRHRIVNDMPVCAVVLDEEKRVSEEELLRFARSRLGSHSPIRTLILDAIPRNEHGKVQRAALQKAANDLISSSQHPLRPSPEQTQDAFAARQRQLLVVISIGFSIPTSPSLEQLDEWLVDVLHLEVRGLPDAGDTREPEKDRLANAWLGRAMLLSRRLLQDVRIPVLDMPKILDCRPHSRKAGAWQAHLAYARVEELSVSAYELALKGGMGLSAWAMERPVDEQSRQAFFDMVGKGVLSKLQPLWSSGKSTLPILRAAHDRSIPFTHLGAGVFQLGWGSKAKRIDRSVTGDVSAIGTKLANDKALTASLLRRACLPSPVHTVVSDLRGALNAAHELGWPVVVKPADRERGEGVSVDVGHADQLKPAFETAFAMSAAKKVIVERQVNGVCHRLFLTHGRLLYAVKRLPMSVVGDGVSDVASLVKLETATQRLLPPWERSGIKPLDDLAGAALSRAGYGPTAVPAKGELVALRRIESTEWGGVDEDVTLRIHPENLKVAVAAAELFGLTVAGIDIISADISQPWFANGAIINEVNHAPLLGGGDISRSHLPAFLDRLVVGTGMIPVEIFVGGQAAVAPARRRWQEMVRSGQRAYLSHAHQTVEPSGEAWHMPAASLYQRTRALVLSPHVQAVVLIVQTDEFLETGLPLEAISEITFVDQLLQSQRGIEPISPVRLQVLIRLLQGWKGRTA